MEEMGKEENTVKWIKGQRIRWLGHLERTEENRMPKLIFSQELEGPRRMGRPRKRWKELAADRKKWRDIVRQAKAHTRL
jgi:hypothetical protein